jgi:hypothetical protein
LARVAGLVALAAACAPRPGLDPSTLPPELAVPAGATKVQPRGDGASFAVQFHLAASYPADEFLRDLQARLAARGWKPMEHDLLNPTIATSNVRGWTAFVDPRNGPPRGVHRWQGSWTNASGDVVDYNLEYTGPENAIDSPPPPPNDLDLAVTAFVFPAAQARAMVEEAERVRKH